MHRLNRRLAGRGPASGRTSYVNIHLLGRFAVVIDGAVAPERCWSRRTAASLIKVLALAPGRRLHREQVIDMLWPDEDPATAAPKLHKAAHFARKASGRRDAVVLRNDIVTLFPNSEVTVDVEVFEELSRRALAGRDGAMASSALDHYAGELLPDDRYEEWAGDRRELLRLRHLNLLRLAGRWIEVSELDPYDEQALAEIERERPEPGDGAAPRGGPIGALVAELADLARRQAFLLAALTAAGETRDTPLSCVAAS